MKKWSVTSSGALLAELVFLLVFVDLEFYNFIFSVWSPKSFSLRSKFEVTLFPSVFPGGVQETETVLCDVWRAGLGVPALWPRTPVWELLHLHRVPALPWTDPGAAALLTSPPTRTTTDSRPVSPDSTDASLWSRPLFKIMSRSFYNVVTTQALIWFYIFKMTFTDEWPVYSAQVTKWKLLLWNLGLIMFPVLPVEHQYILLVIALDQQHCSWFVKMTLRPTVLSSLTLLLNIYIQIIFWYV